MAGGGGHNDGPSGGEGRSVVVEYIAAGRMRVTVGQVDAERVKALLVVSFAQNAIFPQVKSIAHAESCEKKNISSNLKFSDDAPRQE